MKKECLLAGESRSRKKTACTKIYTKKFEEILISHFGIGVLFLRVYNLVAAQQALKIREQS